ncbi:MAG: YitT family protein [Clostridiales bacterium]|nr:YitT family protein [Clostridiales bacterium]
MKNKSVNNVERGAETHNGVSFKLPEKNVTVKYIKEYLIVLLAAVLQAIGVYVFVQPNNFSPGGFLGVGTFVEYLTGFNAGYVFFLVNIPIIIVAMFKFRKDFIFKTIVTIVLDSGLLALMPLINFPQFIVDPAQGGYAFIIAAIAGGIVCGASLALLLKVDGCNGGTEIIGTMLQKRFPATNISWFIFCLDSSVIVLSAFFMDPSIYGGGKLAILTPMLLSLCKMFCASKTSETIIRGFSSAIKFEVVTLHGQELGKELTTELNRGVTIIEARGAYTGGEKQLLICIIRKRQMARFKKILSRYPDTFAYMVPASEVYGQGFTKQVKEGEKETAL